MASSELEQLRGRVMHVLGDLQSLVDHINMALGWGPIDRRPIPIRHLRQQRGWSREHLALQLEAAAKDCRYNPPDHSTVLSMISGWESGLPVDPFYRELFRIVFSVDTHIAMGQ